MEILLECQREDFKYFFGRSGMELEEGTILYDSKWFHNSCWSSANPLSSKSVD